jgi:hypothetical protein
MADLFDMHESGMPVEKIADYLCREVDEVQAKIDEIERQIARLPIDPNRPVRSHPAARHRGKDRHRAGPGLGHAFPAGARDEPPVSRLPAFGMSRSSHLPAASSYFET